MIERSGCFQIFTFIVHIALIFTAFPIAGAEPTRDLGSPTGVKASPGNGYATISWEEPIIGSAGITNYRIYRDRSMDEEVIVGEVEKQIRSYKDIEVENLVTYNYFITALSTIVESEPSDTVSVTPEGDPPSITILSPDNNTFFTTSSVDVSWKVTDETSGIAGVYIYLDDPPYVEKPAIGELACNDLEEGEHEIRIQSMDVAGNTAFMSLHFTVDLAPPVIDILYPENNTIITGRSFNITWKGHDDITSIRGYRIRVGESAWIDIGNQTWYVSKARTTDTISISVGAEDLAGNQVTTGFNVHIDLDPPVVRILEPTDGSFHNSSTISIELDGSDTGTGIRGYTIKVDDGDRAEIGLVTEHIMENLTDGEHEISAAALDGGGLISYSNISIIIDTLPPEISITSPVNRDHLSSNRIFMEWDAVDQLSGIAYMAYSLNNITWTRIPKDSKNTTVRTGTGEQTISLKAVDRAGNQKIIYRIITIDTYGPRISDFGPKEDLVEPDTTIWIIFNEEMDDKSISIIVGGVSGQIHGSGAKFFLEPDLKLAPGTIYNVNVSGRDLAGNPSISFLWEFTVKDTLILFGTVYDENGEPLAGARMILQSGRTTETDADGRFNITARIGESSLEVVKYGYVKQKVELNHTSTENLLVPNIYLQKEEMSIKSGLPAHMKDPFTYIVLVLVLIIIGLTSYLQKDRSLTLLRRIRDMWRRKR